VLLAGDGNTRKTAQQALANSASTPAGVLMFHIQNVVFHLERKLVGVPIEAATSVGQALNTALLIAIEDLIARLARDAETPCRVRPLLRRLAGEPQTAVFRPSPNTPSKASLPPQKGRKCNLCVRYELSPMSQAAQISYAAPPPKSTIS